MAKMTFNAANYDQKDGDWHTFSEWAGLGWGVLKGEKATRKTSDGEFLFHQSQVAPRSGEDWDDLTDNDFIKYFPFFGD